MQVRRLAPHEVELHRDLRLRALQDAPDSFGETFADAAAQPVSYWEHSRAEFRETGARRQVPTNPTLWVVAMEAELRA